MRKNIDLSDEAVKALSIQAIENGTNFSRKTAENWGISHGARTGEVMTRKQFERMRK